MIRADTLGVVPAQLGGIKAASARPRQAAEPARLVIGGCAGLLALIGISVFIGWKMNSDVLMSVIPGHVAMKPNTALGFLLAGSSLAFELSEFAWSRLLSRVAAAFVGAIGLLTFVEYRLHVDLHIDQLLFRDLRQLQYPGRMAQISSVFLILGGVALILLNATRLGRYASQTLGLTLTAGAFISIVAYLYGVPVLYGAIAYNTMALHTGLGFLMLGVALAWGNPPSALARTLSAPEAGGWLARRLLPFIVGVPVLLGWLYLRPAVNFHRPRFAMAMFAVTLVVAGLAALLVITHMANRLERQRDVVMRVRAESEQAARQSEHELRLVTDNLPSLLAYLDSQWRFVRANRTYEQWQGRSASGMLGQSLLEVLGADYWERTRSYRDRAVGGETVTFETIYPTIRGPRQAQITYVPDLDEQGHLRGFISMVLDVEDQRRAEAALRQSEKLAVVGRLASSIAHEINNPLEAVTNLLYLAEQGVAERESASGSMALQCITQAQEQIARISQIATKTLRFHRHTSYKTPCRLAGLIEDVLVLYAGRLMHARVQVERRFQQREPLLCQEGEIRQVLANLVGNAADAMSGGGRLLVCTRTAVNPRSGVPGVVVTVADTGHGIDAETRAKLFEPFHTTKGETGSGLGLWVSQQIIERHQGSVRVRSRVGASGSGTVFRLFLPSSQTG